MRDEKANARIDDIMKTDTAIMQGYKMKLQKIDRATTVNEKSWKRCCNTSP